VWGLDVSESLGGAGGVGGLLWVRLNTSPASGAHFVTYDGNGNVWTLVSASTGTETARYEYGPFGEPLRLTGAAAGSNPFRFSTKRTEDGTGLVLYEHRAYSPALGKWLNRDHIGETGGYNLDGFAYNAPVSFVDVWGLTCQNIFNCGLGISWQGPGIFNAWDFDLNVDQCDRWSSPATIEGCSYCYRVHVKARGEIGVGLKYLWKRPLSINGVGFQAAVSVEFSLAKVGVSGQTTMFICPNPLGTVVDHDSSVVPLVDVTAGPTMSVSVSGGLRAGEHVNINVVGDIAAYASLRATLGVKVVSYGSHGKIKAVGSFSGNIGAKAKLYARGYVYGAYVDWNVADIAWTLCDKPRWAEKEELGLLWSRQKAS